MHDAIKKNNFGRPWTYWLINYDKAVRRTAQATSAFLVSEKALATLGSLDITPHRYSHMEVYKADNIKLQYH